MKKLAFLMAVMMMFTLLLAGCNNTTTPSAPAVSYTHLAVISALITEYQPSFDLGMFGENTMATYDEFVKQLQDAGLEKYMEEWNRQRDEFLASKAA